MSDSYNTRIKLKRDTEENWTSKNPILLDGEMIIVKTNDGKIRKKIGDGVKKFSELPYDEISIDSAISTTSTNPVQNKVITELLNEKIGSNKPTITEPEFLTKTTLKSSNITVYTGTSEYTGDKGENVPGITLHGSNGEYESTNVAIGGIFTPDYNLDGRDDLAVSVYYLNQRLSNKADNTIVNKDKNKAGLMSASDKIKLDGIATGANKTTVDTALSDSSTNPVQNKVIKSELDQKFDKSGGQVDGSIDVTGTVNPKSITFKLASYQTTEIIPNNDPAINEIQFANSFSGTAGPAYCRLAIASPDSNRGSQAVNVDYLNLKLDDKADKTALNSKLDKTGGTLTGNLSGQYIAGTWLRTTDASDLGKAAGKIAVLDESGWVYYRAPSEILNDIGAASISYVDSAITQTINNAY